MAPPFFNETVPDPNGGTFKPGDEVIFVPEENLAPDVLKLYISRRISHLLTIWELPVTTIRQMSHRFPPRRPDEPPPIPEIEPREYPGFVVPQLGAGQYHVYYQSGSEQGQTSTITIVPRIGVRGPDRVEVNRQVTLTAEIVGPLDRPKLIFPASHSNPTNLYLDELWRREQNLDHTVRTEVWVESISDTRVITLQTGDTALRTTDQDGKAAFAFKANVVGTARIRFGCRDFPSVEEEIQVIPHPVRPIFEDSRRPFTILIAGTSLTWGQGLREQNKFTTRVVNWIRQQNNGRQVQRFTYAHSGAKTIPELAMGARDANTASIYHGEVPTAFPSVEMQLRRANEEHHTAPVDLVLLDAGINDITLPYILFPDPLTLFPGWDEMRRKCQALQPVFRRILREAATYYPFRKAGVVVSGYYPIVTDDTPSQYLALLLSAFNLPLGLGTAMAKPILIERCAQFTSATNLALARAAREVNEQFGYERIIFVNPAFRLDNAFWADNTFLWHNGRDDEVVDERTNAGNELIAQRGVDSLDIFAYLVASIGHPNRAGAARYADQIIDALASRTAWWNLRLPRQPLTISVNPVTITIIVQAREVVDAREIRYTVTEGERTVSLSMEVLDAATDSPVEGILVYISDGAEPERYHFLGFIGQELQAHFRYYKDSRTDQVRPPPHLLVSRPMYQDQTVAFRWDPQPNY